MPPSETTCHIPVEAAIVTLIVGLATFLAELVAVTLNS